MWCHLGWHTLLWNLMKPTLRWMCLLLSFDWLSQCQIFFKKALRAESDQYVARDSGAYQPNSSLHSMLFSHAHRHPNKPIFYMLVCRVILGYGLKLPSQNVKSSAFQPNNQRELKYIPGISPPVFHHSLLVDRSQERSFNEVVIFHSDQTYPEYLLAYTHDWVKQLCFGEVLFIWKAAATLPRLLV